MTKHTDLCEQANKALQGVTEGPWAWNVRGFVGPASTEDDQSFGMICDEVAECNYSDGRKEANARFIAFARAWVPEAAAALTALSEQNTSFWTANLRLQRERDALTAQVTELTRERDEWRTAYHKTHEAFSDADAARDAAEAKVARLDGALNNIRELNMTNADENGQQWAHSDLIEQEIVAALTEGTPE